MNLSQSRRKQLVAIDILEGLIDAVRAANPEHERVVEITSRLATNKLEIKKSIAPTREDGSLLFDNEKEYRQYTRLVQKIQDKFVDLWTGEELDAREYINAVLAYIEEIHDNAPDSKHKQEWGALIDDLLLLYRQIDPELTADPQMEFGAKASDKLMEWWE